MIILIDAYMYTPVYMQLLRMYSEGDLGNGLPEEFALSRTDFELKVGWLARAIGTSEGTSTPRRPLRNGESDPRRWNGS